MAVPVPLTMDRDHWIEGRSAMTGERSHPHLARDLTPVGDRWDLATACSRVLTLSVYVDLGSTPPPDACGNCLAELARQTQASLNRS